MNKKIMITGGSGLVGKYLQDILPDAIYLSSKDGDLRNYNQAEDIFKKHKPNMVLNLAARVGGILENINYPAELFSDNILINTNVLNLSLKYGVDHLIGILSTCVFPDNLNKSCYPMGFDHIHQNMPINSNLEYGYSKRCLHVQIDSYKKQYGVRWNSIIIPNLYGIYDNFEISEKSHFVSSLLTKIKTAKDNGDNSIVLFGNGKSLRQFLYTKDFVKAIKQSIEQDIRQDFIIAPPENISIKQMVKIALKSCDAENIVIEFDTSKPSGQYRKDVKNSTELFPNFEFTKLEDGLRETFEYINKQKL